MEPHTRINLCILWFAVPGDISFTMAFILFSLSTLFFGLMSACYYNVIHGNQLINENPVFRMLKESDSFMKNIKDNACGSQLLKEYIWLNNF
jgi:hypothetical protein